MTPLKLLIIVAFIVSVVLAVMSGAILVDPVLWALWVLCLPVVFGGIIPGP